MALVPDPDAFLRDYWQRRPLLVRNAIPGWQPPIDADELAGLAMEDGVESRIIDTAADGWQLHQGPFPASAFDRPNPWTLLVQAVDHHVPEVATLRRQVSFLPTWRIDDVMVSYASDGGSVGPHYDNYDVFLIQGHGRREWRLGQRCDENTPLRPHPALRLLQQFEQNEVHVLAPGDMLYVPPGVAHWGIAQGDCTTFSLGFRAPRLNHLLSCWVDEVLESMAPDRFFSDRGRSGAGRPGEIVPEDLDRARAQLLQALAADRSRRWLGECATQPRYELETDMEQPAYLKRLLHNGSRRIALRADAKLAWQAAEQGLTVFANGFARPFDCRILDGLVALCEHWELAGEEFTRLRGSEAGVALLDFLLENECIDVE